MIFSQMNKEALSEQLSVFWKEYENYKSKQLSLDLSRGKPGAVQLDLL